MNSFIPRVWGDVPAVEKNYPAADNEKTDAEPGLVLPQDRGNESDSDGVSSTAQFGVQQAEATASTWKTWHLIAAYVFIWIIAFIDSMQQAMSNSLLPYVTSAFGKHSLVATTQIMANLIGGLFKLPLAKILDIWGRPQGFAFMVFLLTIGLIMMAGCNNVQTYAAAQVFYWVGYNGIVYTIGIFVADTSALKNRALMFAFINTPYIATVWIGGPLATQFLNGSGFRWGYGTFAIVTPVVASPLIALFFVNHRKAKRAGLLPQRESKGTFLQATKYYFIEFDIIGIILLAGGLALFLLPFSLYTYQSNGWRSSMIICMIIFGGLLIIAFGLYEKFLAPKCFIPYNLLTDRTVVGACLLAGDVFVAYYIWDNYFPSFLQVVNRLSVTESSYVTNIYTIGSSFFSVIVGLLIKWTGRFKWVALYFGVPLNILGIGLMIHFRQPDMDVGFIVMCQIFIAFAGGAIVICEQMAVMAATTHQYVAVVLAVEGMFSQIGGAIGSTIAAAIWTGVFPKKLAEFLPPESQGDMMKIYGGLGVQLSYPVGSPTRNAIDRAYGEAQKYMCIGATAILVLSIVGTIMMRDIKVKDFKQVKGNVI